VEQKEFEHITQGVRSRVMSVAAFFRLAEEDAEDIAQDTMLRLWTMRDELKRYRSVEALAVSVARHLCIDSLKRRITLPLNGKIISDVSLCKNKASLLSADEKEVCAYGIKEMQKAAIDEYDKRMLDIALKALK